MRLVSTAWIPVSVADFEMHACLEIHAMRGAATAGYPYEVFVLDGFEKLPASYIDDLASKNVLLRDVGAQTREVLARFEGLQSLYNAGQGSQYETLCFVRWIVMKQVLAGEPFLHIDTDLFFQESNAFICGLFEGRTGTFGSPCLTVVSDPAWLDHYEEGLNRIATDRAAYQQELGYGGNEFRKDISSDQDLVIAMEAAGLLPVVGMADLREAYQVFINPLWPYKSPPGRTIKYEDIDGRDYIDGKPVLFWHLQNNCADYLSRYMTLKNFAPTWLGEFLPQRLDFPFIQLKPNAENFAFLALRNMSWQIIHEKQAAGPIGINDFGVEGFFARTWISQWFIIQRQGRELFSNGYWWEEGLFE